MEPPSESVRAAPEYIHGTSPKEQARLELMNRLLNQRCLAAIAPRPGDVVLEMGAGTGIFAADLARAVGPTGRVVAVERDPAQLAEARRRADEVPNLEVRGGDAYAPPLSEDEWGTFDLVHARFLLEHLDRPGEAVERMVRATRCGGRIALCDDDHSLMRFDPDCPSMERLWWEYSELYAQRGNDPLIGRRLASLLAAAGAPVERTTQIDYGASRGEAEFDGVVRNLAEVLEGAFELIAGAEEAVDEFLAWARGETATVWYALPLAIGRRPE